MNANPLSPSPEQPIGYIVGGGLKENFRVRLTVAPQQVQEGAFVLVRSGGYCFYGLVTDLQLGSTDPRFADEQTETRLPPGLAGLLHGQTLYANLEVLPALMQDQGPELSSPAYAAWRKANPNPPLIPVKTIPLHHAPVYLAGAADVAAIFGAPEEKGNFVIGATREQGHPVCLNLEKFIQRSSGIFGATGTGKSFLTRIILAGLIHYNAASILIFDMHNEYGFDDIASDTKKRVTGLRAKFPGRVRVVGLGRGSIRTDQVPDFNLEVGMNEITPADVEMLSRELNLKETTPTTLDALVHSFGRERWFTEFMQLRPGAVVENEDGKKVPAPDSVEAWAADAGVNSMAASALHSKLQRVKNRAYVVEKAEGDALNEIIRSLQAGKHIVLSFGNYESDLDYLLVTNLLTRRIREKWEELTNQFRGHNGAEPRPLVIAVEEAHKLLNREIAAQTAFSTIAREMRKYYVTLLVIDQRPSQIYDEVMSQLGTRISGWLGDDSDIQAVLSGLAERDALRGMLARLQPREEVLLLGWGVPMPMMVRSRRYDERFWQELLGKNSLSERSTEDILKDLGG